MASMEKKSLKIKIIIVAVAAVILAAIIGIIAFSNSPAQKLKKQLDLGQKYLNELYYEQAVAAFVAAIEIDPQNEEAKKFLVSTLDSWCQKCYEDGDIEKAKEIVKNLADYDAGLAMEWNEKIAIIGLRKYSDIVDELISFYDEYEEVFHQTTFGGNEEQSKILSIGASDANRYATFDQKKTVYQPIIDRLLEYTSYLNKFHIKELVDVDYIHNGNGIFAAIDGKHYLKMIYAYECLANMYLSIGDMDNAYAIRLIMREKEYLTEEQVEANYYTPTNDKKRVLDMDTSKMTFDKYGRLLSYENGSEVILKWGIGNEIVLWKDEYSTESFSYENGRVVSTEFVSADPDSFYSSEISQYSYDDENHIGTCKGERTRDGAKESFEYRFSISSVGEKNTAGVVD